MTPGEALRAAIKACRTAADLSRRLGITEQAIHQWNRVPSGRVIEVERVSGVSRHDLRPDLYPRETAAPAKARPKSKPSRRLRRAPLEHVA